MASLQETFAQRQNESANQINNLYDKQNQAQAAGLKAEYDKNMSDAQAGLQKVRPMYQEQANALAGRYDQQRRNANLSAMTSGLGSGTGLQQQNALRNQYMANYAGLRGQEAGAINDANQKIADLTTNYNNALVQAQDESNVKRDQELIKANTANRDWYEKQAQDLTAYGNFDQLKSIYGEAQTNQMRNTWIAQNPDVAFRSGMISGDEYKKITGKSSTPTPAYPTQNITYQSIYD